jgi:hypothetical protein
MERIRELGALLCLPYIPHGLPRQGTHVAALRNHRLISEAVAGYEGLLKTICMFEHCRRRYKNWRHESKRMENKSIILRHFSDTFLSNLYTLCSRIFEVQKIDKPHESRV